MGWEIRAWRRADGPELLRMLREWAELEGGPRPSCEEALLAALHGAAPPPVLLVAERSGPPLGGFAVASWGFSTWRGRDLRVGELWVPPALRDQGLQELLLRGVAQVAVAAGCAQLRVEVGGEGAPLDPPSFGAVDLGSSEGWLGVSFQGAALQELAGAPPLPQKRSPSL
ncbi:thialysine N-epsilon-acetyltransferase-like isoform X1 [Tympanuchus pallidicinctus]|uniref:thialysine N-epsilon-acetyltransferase-like isoform X1 n=1 Tax=Tympanuchus pallidicinctus TaxID=109042 RepID=UPI0022874F76|nr:thialysine N-epsilon-acetyltransferase-like isoform X1 [Tympanuchus pallidicinctus]